MISEIDIRDWERVDVQKLERQVLEGGMLNQNALLNFVKLVGKIQERQMKEYKNKIPSLLKNSIGGGDP